MQDETIAKVEADIKEWEYLKHLPDKWYDFKLDRTTAILESFYDIYSYTNEELHRKATIYYHEETREYKVRIKIGVTEFCKEAFITAKLVNFERLLNQQFDALLYEMENYDIKRIGRLVRKAGILNWQNFYELPKECEGFLLFITPAKPEKITNGSYIIVDYVDFAIESDLSIYYNVFRDEYFGEVRINGSPHVNYDFDAESLDALGEKLNEFLVPNLKATRVAALKEIQDNQK